MPFIDPTPSYWAEYTNLQKAKHDLIRSYLGGWFPKLGLWAGRIIYFDTHAGRGEHTGGEPGSPLVALDTFLTHRSRDAILKKSEVNFYFIERDPANATALEAALAARGSLPDRVRCVVECADCFGRLTELVAWFEQPNRELAPAFFFIDPYGFKVPGSILRRLMQFGRVELFVNIIWRELDMGGVLRSVEIECERLRE